MTQEPAAYINIEERKLEWAHKYMSWDTPTVVNLPKIPLYTHQRTWVGLTDEEREELMDTYDVASTDYAQAIEAKLKEKNT
jgi:TRAP-type C4-dicarboxylate transport system substrate-binding protein